MAATAQAQAEATGRIAPWGALHARSDRLLPPRLLADTCRMPEHDPTRTDRLALYMRAGAAEKAAHDDAVRVVAQWNIALAAGGGVLWSPTIRAALLAGTPWLDVYCPGCRTSRAIDIRTIDRHPLASVGSLVLGLRCSMCSGSIHSWERASRINV